MTCSGGSACKQGVDCSGASSCTVGCTGISACAGLVTCGKGRCGVTCTNSFAGEDVDPATMLSAAGVAETVFRNCTLEGNLAVEELVLQPASGIRL